jgi:uncharacterized protein (DUF1800 family)
MTLREKLAHLHRRLGFGATPAELDIAERLGFEGTLRRLIDFEGVSQEDACYPHEFYWREKEEADVGAYRLRTWWYLNMLATPRPLQEKLAIFWHSHFAVSDGKVEDGMMMLEYLQALRQKGTGRFVDLLGAISKSPAMMRYLDMDRSMKGRPNENFAREVMELFTMGIGNYSEADVKEVARALTGWGYLNLYYEMPGNADQKLKDALRDGRPLSTFVNMVTVRDDRPKTILGQTRDFDGDAVLDLLAKQPATARFLATKLWTFFAYEDPSPKVVEKLADAFLASKGDIKKTMHALVRMDEFWGDQCVRRQPKNPVDFVVGIGRAQGLGASLLEFRAKDATATTRIPQRIMDELWIFPYRAERQGMNLLYPPNVAGWKWGSHWVTPAALAERYQFQGSMYWNDKGAQAGSLNPLAFVRSKIITDSMGIADAICELFDVPLPLESRKIIATLFDQAGGPKALEDKNMWTDRFYRTMKLISAAPEMQVA